MKQNHLYSHTEIVIDDKTVDALTNIGNTFAKAKKITVYIDHYLNTITYHYTTYYPSGGTVLTGVSETGYIFQSRERLEREIAGNMPPQLDDFLGKLKNILDTTKKLSDKQLKDIEEKNKREEAKKLDELMKVPSIKSAYKDLEITNKKLIETAEKIERLGRNHSHDNLNTFLQNTQYEVEMNKLRAEYNTIARECLIQLTKLRMNIQKWTFEHPEYAKVVDRVLYCAEKGAIIVAGIGAVSVFAATAEISVPVAIVGASIALAKGYTINSIYNYYIKDKLIEYAKRQGITQKEKCEFMETATWILEGIAGIRKLGKTVNGIRNYKELIQPKFAKTYISKVDKYGEIAVMLNKASRDYYKSQRQQLREDILRLFANG